MLNKIYKDENIADVLSQFDMLDGSNINSASLDFTLKKAYVSVSCFYIDNNKPSVSRYLLNISFIECVSMQCIFPCPSGLDINWPVEILKRDGLFYFDFDPLKSTKFNKSKMFFKCKNITMQISENVDEK